MLAMYGEDYLRTLWQDMGGGPKAAKIISEEMNEWVTEANFDYLAKLYHWKRKLDKNHPLAIAAERGTIEKAYYSHLIFPGDEGYE